jgi:hypothetical protein
VIASPVRAAISGVHAVLVSADHEDPHDVRAVARFLSFASGALEKLVHCTACSGFWYGLAIGSLPGVVGFESPWNPIVTALAVMGTNAVVDALLVGALALTDPRTPPEGT